MNVKNGSKIAKAGFQNEKDVVGKFNNWENDVDAQEWLKIMEYDLNEIEYVEAILLKGYKADIQVQVNIKLKTAIDTQNIQIKLVSNFKGYNQVDKRWVDSYKDLWNIPDDVVNLLKYFSGEYKPFKESRNKNRMYVDEFSLEEQAKVLDFFKDNKTLVLCDILKGRGNFAAEWMLVIQKTESVRWVLKPINVVLNYYGIGEVELTSKGNIKLGKITIQRKGGDKGKFTANMLQFKLNPAELFN